VKTGDQIVQRLPWKWGVQGKIFIIGGLGFMFDAWDIALNGFLTPLVGMAFEVSAADRGYIATANLIGMAIGAVIWGSIADRIGRKKAFTITLLIFALFSVVGAVAPNYEIFILLRFLAGIGLGGCIPVDYALVSEFTPKHVRGRVMTALNLWWPIGVTLAGVSSLLLVNVPESWRWMLVLMVLPALLIVWIRRGIPESPIYLSKRGAEEEARRVIDELVEKTGASVEAYVIPPVVEEKEKTGFMAGWEQIKGIWTKFPGITFAAWFLFGTIMTVYYTALSWLPTLLAESGAGETISFLGTTIMAAIGIFGCIIAIALIDRIGRKWLLAIGSLLSASALVGIGATLQVTGLALVLIAVFGLVVQIVIPVLYAYTSEIYPTLYRASGFAWASSFSRVVTGLMPIVFSAWAFPVLGVTNTFIVLLVASVLAIIVMSRLAPETRGKDLDNIGIESSTPNSNRHEEVDSASSELLVESARDFTHQDSR
jgi:putative MFS transporter